jgi:RNA polymerase primary sigma factor
MVARDKLATANLRFVISVAKMYGGTSDPELFNDLVSVGNIGLIEAAEKFDHSRGFKFISFAVWHIRKEMIKHLGDNSRMVRIPQNKISELRVMVDVMNILAMKLGREATVEEAMEYMEETEDTRIKSLTFDKSNIMRVMNANAKHDSLDSPFKNDGSNDNTIKDVLISDVSSTDSFCVTESMERMTKLLVAGLKPIEKTVVLRRHGIGNLGFEESYDGMSHDLGVSPERIRQIYLRALKRMNIRVRKLKLQRDDVLND